MPDKPSLAHCEVAIAEVLASNALSYAESIALLEIVKVKLINKLVEEEVALKPSDMHG